jgi:2'-hydroxyisoflavone reductase
MPLWVPREYAGMLEVDCGRAIAAGLTFRPVSQTIRDVLEWDSKRGEPDLGAGLKPERERELLSAWRGGNL